MLPDDTTNATARPDMARKWAAVRAERTPPNPSGLCMCGCGQQTKIASSTDPVTENVLGHPQKYLRGHNKRAAKAYEVDPETGCWRWLLATDAKGYPLMKHRGRERRAHIVFYETKYGPVPKGTELDHVRERGCRYRDCVNPDHLEPVTHAVNIRRGRATKLTEAQTAEVAALCDTGVPAKEIASRYGITIGRVYQIRTAHRRS